MLAPSPPATLFERLIPLREVKERVGYGTTTIYELIKLDAFPRPVKAGVGNSSRWVLSEIECYVRNAIAVRDLAITASAIAQ